MHRVDTDGNVGNLFDEGDPLVPRLPTQVDAAILNAFQEELANAITTAGVALVKGTNNQLASVMMNLTTAQTVTGKKTFTRPGGGTVLEALGDNSMAGGVAIRGEGGGTSPGVVGSGNTRGTGTGPGGQFTGTGPHEGVHGTGGPSSGGAPGGVFTNGSGTTNSLVRTITVENGHIGFDGSMPAATAALPPNVAFGGNMVKGWGVIDTGLGIPVVFSGINIAGLASVGAPGSKNVRVTLATVMASAAYCVLVAPIVPLTVGTLIAVPMATNLASGSFDITAINPTTGAQISLDGVTISLAFIVLGAQ